MSKSQWMREFVRGLGNTYLVQSCLSVFSLSVSVTKILEQCTILIWSRRETHPASWNIQTSASTKYLLNITTTRLSPSRLNLREISFSPDAAKTKWYPLRFYLKHDCQNIFLSLFSLLVIVSMVWRTSTCQTNQSGWSPERKHFQLRKKENILLNLEGIWIWKATLTVSGSFAPTVSGRKELAMAPIKETNIEIRYGNWNKKGNTERRTLCSK